MVLPCDLYLIDHRDRHREGEIGSRALSSASRSETLSGGGVNGTNGLTGGVGDFLRGGRGGLVSGNTSSRKGAEAAGSKSDQRSSWGGIAIRYVKS